MDKHGDIILRIFLTFTAIILAISVYIALHKSPRNIGALGDPNITLSEEEKAIVNHRIGILCSQLGINGTTSIVDNLVQINYYVVDEDQKEELAKTVDSYNNWASEHNKLNKYNIRYIKNKQIEVEQIYTDFENKDYFSESMNSLVEYIENEK